MHALKILTLAVVMALGPIGFATAEPAQAQARTRVSQRAMDSRPARAHEAIRDRASQQMRDIRSTRESARRADISRRDVQSRREANRPDPAALHRDVRSRLQERQAERRVEQHRSADRLSDRVSRHDRDVRGGDRARDVRPDVFSQYDAQRRDYSRDSRRSGDSLRYRYNYRPYRYNYRPYLDSYRLYDRPYFRHSKPYFFDHRPYFYRHRDYLYKHHPSLRLHYRYFDDDYKFGIGLHSTHKFHRLRDHRLHHFGHKRLHKFHHGHSSGLHLHFRF